MLLLRSPDVVAGTLSCAQKCSVIVFLREMIMSASTLDHFAMSGLAVSWSVAHCTPVVSPRCVDERSIVCVAQ